jgi:hypothetical protein
MENQEMIEKRKQAFASEQGRLIIKYPDKEELIKTEISKATSDGCGGCKSGRIMKELFNKLGEPIPPPPPQQMQMMQQRMNPYGQNSMNQPISPEVMAMQSADAPRPPCEECFKEHIAKAVVLLTEASLGYPEHRWLAIANVAEASAEILGINKELAVEVRGIKLRMIQDSTFIPDLMKYLR